TNPTLGGSMAEFLLGLPTSGSLDIYSPAKDDSWYTDLFVNDDWHVKPNPTVNLGLRWEHDGATTESHHRQNIRFDPPAVNQVSAAAAAAYAKNPQSPLPTSAYSATGGLIFASPSHRGSYNTTNTEFAPRVGISWSPTSLHNKTVIRAGTGLFYYNVGVL